jgi:hypothetical protein
MFFRSRQGHKTAFPNGVKAVARYVGIDLGIAESQTGMPVPLYRETLFR